MFASGAGLAHIFGQVDQHLKDLRCLDGAVLVLAHGLLVNDWTTVRKGVEVKLVSAPDGIRDTFIPCRSAQRRLEEPAMHDLFDTKMQVGLNRLTSAAESGRLRSRDVLQQRLGRLKKECSRVARAYRIDVRGDDESLSVPWFKDEAHAAYMRHTEGAYLLRTNLTGESEQSLWHMYMQLNDTEAAFRTLKQDLTVSG